VPIGQSPLLYLCSIHKKGAEHVLRAGMSICKAGADYLPETRAMLTRMALE